MNPFAAWKRPVAMLEQIVGLIALGGIWYWWLGIAESTISRTLLSVSVLLPMVAGFLFLVRRGRSRLARQPGSTGQSLAALLLMAMSLAAAYYLIWWVPGISSLRGQMVSMVLRFGAAFLLIITFWTNLLGSLSRTTTQ